MDTKTTEVLIVGASLGGVAAALSAARHGASVCLIEASTWLGGQFTAQGVTKPDENDYIETTGSTASYRAFRTAVRTFYQTTYTLSEKGKKQTYFNPGGASSGFSMEPLVGHNTFANMLAAYPTIEVIFKASVSGVEMNGDGIVSLTANDLGGNATRYVATYYLDATDLGELLPRCGQEGQDWVIGAESKADTGEPDAPDVENPNWIQSLTFPFAIEHMRDGANYTIPMPTNYVELDSTQNYRITDGDIGKLFPPGDNLWDYRSVIDASNFDDPAFPNDITIINCDSNDCQFGTLPSPGPLTDDAVIAKAREVSVGYLYWLQAQYHTATDSTVQPNPELKLRPDLFDTPDGTSAQPYIRESRRIKARKTVVEQDLLTDGPRAVPYPDSCGIGLYGAMDVHGCAGIGTPAVFVEKVKPFQIPLGALIPVRLTNLLPACKNIGTTHLTNGAYRVHPCEWNVGESAGALAAFCIKNGVSPVQVATVPAQLKQFQHILLADGVPIFWWADVHFGAPEFAAAHLLGVNGIVSSDPDLSFRPKDPLTPKDKTDIESSVGKPLPWPATVKTRADAAIWLADYLQL